MMWIILALFGGAGLFFFFVVRAPFMETTVDGQVVRIPLPLFAVKIDDHHYAAIMSRDHFAKAGWKHIDQMGSVEIVSNGHVTVDIGRRSRWGGLISILSVQNY